MELAPGVIVREGNRVKKGPRQVGRCCNADLSYKCRKKSVHEIVTGFVLDLELPYLSESLLK